MSKLPKIFAVSLLLLVSGAFLVVQLVDPNDFKDQIEVRAAEAVGREVRIDGDMRLSLLPRPALEIERLVLGSALGVDGPPLAEVNLVRLVPRIWSLLQARVELDLVRLEGLRLHLIRDEQGRASWGLAAVSPAPMTSVQIPLPQYPLALARPRDFLDVTVAEAPPARHGPIVRRLEVGGAQLTWDDRREGRFLLLEDVELSAHPVVAMGRSIALRITAVARDAEESAPVELRAEGNLLIDASMNRLRLDAFRLGLDGLRAGAGVELALLLQAGLDGDLAARRFFADELTLDLHVTGAAFAGGSIDVNAGARVEMDLDTETLKVTDLSVRSGTLSARGTALGQSLLFAPVLTGDLALDPFDLRAWLERGGLPVPWTADPDTFRQVSFATCWRLEQGQLGLQDLLLGIDETHFSGGVEQIVNGPTHYRFDLWADLLDMDRYLPPQEGAQAGSGKTSQLRAPLGPVTSKVAFHHETAPGFMIRVGTPAAAPPGSGARRFRVFPSSLGDLGLDGRLRISELKLAGLRGGNADLRVRAMDGRLDLDDRVERFYQGRLSGSLSLDHSAAESKVTLAQRAAAIDTGALLVDLTGTDSLTGRGEITVDLAATGRGSAALRNSLAGDLAIHVTDGAVKGFSLERMIADARARLTGERPSTGMSNQTDFKDLRASGEIKAGVLSNRDLVAIAEKLRVTGEGTLDLVRERFDYRFAPMLVQPPNGERIKELEGIPVPVHLTGSFARPRWNVDVAGALRAVAERELRGQGGGLLKKLEERTGIKGLEQGLRGLFGR